MLPIYKSLIYISHFPEIYWKSYNKAKISYKYKKNHYDFIIYPILIILVPKCWENLMLPEKYQNINLGLIMKPRKGQKTHNGVKFH